MPEADGEITALLRAAGCVYPDDEARILMEASRSRAELRSLAHRRASGEPLEYVVGWAEFCGLRIPVCDGVFVPRRRSEFLASCASDLARSAVARLGVDSRRIKVLDMCCGSGAIGLVVARRVDRIELHSADSSPVAVECAVRNLAEVEGRVHLGDLFAALPETERGTFDLIVANVPYVPTREIEKMPAEARVFEPRSALDGGWDGLDLQRRLFAKAAVWLSRPGLVLVETSDAHARESVLIARENGFTAEIRESSESNSTVVVAEQGL